jgi:hypothetical protein
MMRLWYCWSISIGCCSFVTWMISLKNSCPRTIFMIPAKRADFPNLEFKHYRLQRISACLYSMCVCAKINLNVGFESEEKNKSLLHYRFKIMCARMVNSFENKWDDESKQETIRYEVHVRVRQVPFSMNWKWSQVACNKFALIYAIISRWFSICACQATSYLPFQSKWSVCRAREVSLSPRVRLNNRDTYIIIHHSLLFKNFLFFRYSHLFF